MASSSSSSSAQSLVRPDEMYCWCDEKMYVRTSWSLKNPRRRYIGCPNFGKGGVKNCKRFRFLDSELPSQYYKELMLEMMQNQNLNPRVKDLEMEVAEAKSLAKMWMKEATVNKAYVEVYHKLFMVVLVLLVIASVCVGVLVNQVKD